PSPFSRGRQMRVIPDSRASCACLPCGADLSAGMRGFPDHERRTMASLSTTTARATAPDQRRRTILFADDDASVRKLASLALRALGYDAIVAASGDEALAAIADHGDQIGCVLMDLTMPGTDGAVATRRIHQIDP